MKYIKVMVEGEEEITRDEAKKCLKTSYTERVCTYDEMLDTMDYIPCMFCGIRIENNEEEKNNE